MEASQVAQEWLESLPANHQRITTFQSQFQQLVALLSGLSPTDQERVLEVLGENSISISSVKRFLGDGHTVAEIAHAAELYDALRADAFEQPFDWGLDYNFCLQLAHLFPDDEVGDTISLLLRYRDFVQPTHSGENVPKLREILPDLLTIAGQLDSVSVGGVLSALELLEDSRRQTAHGPFEDLDPHRKPNLQDLAVNYGGFEDDDLGQP